jgi:hypothetical protein
VLYVVSGLRNTAYSQFYLQQLPQTNATRTAILRTNVSFDFDVQGNTSVLEETTFPTNGMNSSRSATRLVSLHVGYR